MGDILDSTSAVEAVRHITAPTLGHQPQQRGSGAIRESPGLYEMENSVTVRLSVNINDETDAALRELAQRRGTSVTEIIRRAVAVYKFVEDEVGQKGMTLQLQDPANDQVTNIAMIG